MHLFFMFIYDILCRKDYSLKTLVFFRNLSIIRTFAFVRIAYHEVHVKIGCKVRVE